MTGPQSLLLALPSLTSQSPLSHSLSLSLSLPGWAPSTFVSSRSNRASKREQQPSDFLDDDEREEQERESFATSAQFDTFGFTATELGRRQARREEAARPSAFVAGAALEDLLAPVALSVGERGRGASGGREELRGAGKGEGQGLLKSLLTTNRRVFSPRTSRFVSSLSSHIFSSLLSLLLMVLPLLLLLAPPLSLLPLVPWLCLPAAAAPARRAAAPQDGVARGPQPGTHPRGGLQGGHEGGEEGHGGARTRTRACACAAGRGCCCCGGGTGGGGGGGGGRGSAAWWLRWGCCFECRGCASVWRAGGGGGHTAAPEERYVRAGLRCVPRSGRCER